MNTRGIKEFYLQNPEWTAGGEIFDFAIHDTPNLGRQEFYNFGELKNLSKPELKKFVRDFNLDIKRWGLAFVERTIPNQAAKSMFGTLKLELSFDSDYRREIPVLKLTVTNESKVRKTVISIRPEEFSQFKIWDHVRSNNYPLNQNQNLN